MKKILIYGGNGSVGKAIVSKLHEKGYPLHLVGRNEEELSKFAKEFDASYTIADVTDPESFKRVALETGKELGGLVYAVGTINLKSIRRLEYNDYINDFRINALGAALAIKASLSALKKGDGQSSIILYSSVAVRRGFPLHASVGMAKGAVEGLVVSLAAELAPSVRVNGIAPSILDKSQLSADLLKSNENREKTSKSHALQRLGTPEDIAAMTLFLLSDESSWMTGQIIGVDGGRSTL